MRSRPNNRRGAKTSSKSTSGCQPLGGLSTVQNLEELVDVKTTGGSLTSLQPGPGQNAAPKRKRRTKKEMEEARHLHRLDEPSGSSMFLLGSNQAESYKGKGKRRMDPEEAESSQAALNRASGSQTNKSKPKSPPKPKKLKSEEAGSSQDKDVGAGGEKRLARYRPKMPSDVSDRVMRVLSQRMMMIHRERKDVEGSCPREEFAILGSVGNVYTVSIGQRPECTCPDSKRNQLCKHVLFVYLKVLGVPQNSPLIYQKALLTEEVVSIFQEAKSDPSAIAQERLREIYEAKRAGDSAKVSALEEKYQRRRKISEDDTCPVCFCEFEEDDKDNIFCQVCGNPCHKACFEGWEQSRKKQGQPLTCVYCRSPWNKTKKSPIKSDYVNLAEEAGLEGIRDTSTYYHGPRRGFRRWERADYDEYDDNTDVDDDEEDDW